QLNHLEYISFSTEFDMDPDILDYFGACLMTCSNLLRLAIFSKDKRYDLEFEPRGPYSAISYGSRLRRRLADLRNEMAEFNRKVIQQIVPAVITEGMIHEIIVEESIELMTECHISMQLRTPRQDRFWKNISMKTLPRMMKLEMEILSRGTGDGDDEPELGYYKSFLQRQRPIQLRLITFNSLKNPLELIPMADFSKLRVFQYDGILDGAVIDLLDRTLGSTPKLMEMS